MVNISSKAVLLVVLGFSYYIGSVIAKSPDVTSLAATLLKINYFRQVATSISEMAYTRNSWTNLIAMCRRGISMFAMKVHHSRTGNRREQCGGSGPDSAIASVTSLAPLC